MLFSLIDIKKANNFMYLHCRAAAASLTKMGKGPGCGQAFSYLSSCETSGLSQMVCSSRGHNIER